MSFRTKCLITIPIQRAACNGHTEIVKILAHLTDNPNATNKYGWTPYQLAAKYCNAATSAAIHASIFKKF